MSIPSFDSPVVIHWFRRDLRWQDNRALHAALTSGHDVVPLFVFDRTILDKLEAEDDVEEHEELTGHDVEYGQLD